MPRFIHSVCVQEKAIASDVVDVVDLPVNPLSALIINLRPLNETSTLSNYQRYLDLCSIINRLTILYRGQSVISMSGQDIAAMNYLRWGVLPRESNPDDTDNERRMISLPILFGRYAYDQSCCFPSTKRGELTMELDLDSVDTGYDNLRYSIESIELPGATPSEYERRCTIFKTFSATGDQDFELPTGYPNRGLLLFGNTGFTGAAPAPTWGRISVLRDSEQIGFNAIDFETAISMNGIFGRQPPVLDLHTHRVDGSSAVTTLESSGPIEQGMGGWDKYAFLDFDPTRDDAYTLDTASARSLSIRATVETADACRVVPVERVAL